MKKLNQSNNATTFAYAILFTMSVPLCASAPAQQSMDAAMNAIVKDNETLRNERDQLQKLVKQYQNAAEPSCCDRMGNKCSDMGDRADHMCNQWIAEPCRIASCQNRTGFYSSKQEILVNIAKISVGTTCCLPYNIVRGLFCGTTYVCCGSECSATCLNLKD